MLHVGRRFLCESFLFQIQENQKHISHFFARLFCWFFVSYVPWMSIFTKPTANELIQLTELMHVEASTLFLFHILGVSRCCTKWKWKTLRFFALLTCFPVRARLLARLQLKECFQISTKASSSNPSKKTEPLFLQFFSPRRIDHEICDFDKIEN